MRVLVTGGSGYIGSCAVRHLAAAGHEVVILDNLSTGHKELARGFELVVGDIADRKLVDGLLTRVDAVMHFAASAYVGESVTNLCSILRIMWRMVWRCWMRFWRARCGRLCSVRRALCMACRRSCR